MPDTAQATPLSDQFQTTDSAAPYPQTAPDLLWDGNALIRPSETRKASIWELLNTRLQILLRRPPVIRIGLMSTSINTLVATVPKIPAFELLKAAARNLLFSQLFDLNAKGQLIFWRRVSGRNEDTLYAHFSSFPNTNQLKVWLTSRQLLKSCVRWYAPLQVFNPSAKAESWVPIPQHPKLFNALPAILIYALKGSLIVPVTLFLLIAYIGASRANSSSPAALSKLLDLQQQIAQTKSHNQQMQSQLNRWIGTQQAQQGYHKLNQQQADTGNLWLENLAHAIPEEMLLSQIRLNQDRLSFSAQAATRTAFQKLKARWRSQSGAQLQLQSLQQTDQGLFRFNATIDNPLKN
ncbi:MAG: hypothetical protein ACR2PW_01675 [Gammaproteobacteria bacterium]